MQGVQPKYAEQILEIISPYTIFASSILGRHCKALGKAPHELVRDDIHYLAIAIERSVTLFAGADKGKIVGARIQKLRGSDPAIRPSQIPPGR